VVVAKFMSSILMEGLNNVTNI